MKNNKRMSGRRVCSKCANSYHIEYKKPAKEGICDACGGELVQRKDDAPETVLARLAEYHQMTEPLKDFYDKLGKLVVVEGQEEVAQTTALVYVALRINMIVLKSSRELELMKEACQISAEALLVAGEAVKPGVSTKEIDEIAYKFIKKHGATPNF